MRRKAHLGAEPRRDEKTRTRNEKSIPRYGGIIQELDNWTHKEDDQVTKPLESTNKELFWIRSAHENRVCWFIPSEAPVRLLAFQSGYDLFFAA